MRATILLLVLMPCAANAATTASVPGAINPAVTQENIKTTICRPGWAATQRPPEDFTEALKKKALGSHYSAATMKAYEWDHAIPIELGGAPRDPNNMWLQPWAGKCGAHAKDKLENSLRRDVCAGRKTLAEARVAVMQWCP